LSADDRISQRESGHRTCDAADAIAQNYRVVLSIQSIDRRQDETRRGGATHAEAVGQVCSVLLPAVTQWCDSFGQDSEGHIASRKNNFAVRLRNDARSQSEVVTSEKIDPHPSVSIGGTRQRVPVSLRGCGRY